MTDDPAARRPRRDPDGGLTVTTHEITVQRVVGPYDGPFHIAVCSCGAYQSGRWDSPGRAERCGLEHAAAKTTTEA